MHSRAVAVGQAEVDMELVDYARQGHRLHAVEQADEALLVRTSLNNGMVTQQHRERIGGDRVCSVHTSERSS